MTNKKLWAILIPIITGLIISFVTLLVNRNILLTQELNTEKLLNIQRQITELDNKINKLETTSTCNKSVLEKHISWHKGKGDLLD